MDNILSEEDCQAATIAFQKATMHQGDDRRFDSTRLDSTRLDATRRDSTRLDSTLPHRRLVGVVSDKYHGGLTSFIEYHRIEKASTP